MLLTVSLAGCLETFDSTTKPRATLEAYPLLIQEGEMVTFDARQSDAIEGIITAYRWDFGDGEKTETVTGFTSHIYDIFGAYTVSLEVENDQGGVDEAFTVVVVNGVPTIELTYPKTREQATQYFSTRPRLPTQNLLSYPTNGTWIGVRIRTVTGTVEMMSIRLNHKHCS